MDKIIGIQKHAGKVRKWSNLPLSISMNEGCNVISRYIGTNFLIIFMESVPKKINPNLRDKIEKLSPNICIHSSYRWFMVAVFSMIYIIP